MWWWWCVRRLIYAVFRTNWWLTICGFCCFRPSTLTRCSYSAANSLTSTLSLRQPPSLWWLLKRVSKQSASVALARWWVTTWWHARWWTASWWSATRWHTAWRHSLSWWGSLRLAQVRHWLCVWILHVRVWGWWLRWSLLKQINKPAKNVLLVAACFVGAHFVDSVVVVLD